MPSAPASLCLSMAGHPLVAENSQTALWHILAGDQLRHLLVPKMATSQNSC